MTIEEVKKEIKKINTYLNNCLWMDFEVCQMSFIKVVLAGRIDQSVNKYAIEIEFEEPYCISSLFSWSIDTDVSFIELATEEETLNMNITYRVEQGNYIFKVNVEDFDKTPIFIAAKRVKCLIIEDNENV